MSSDSTSFTRNDALETFHSMPRFGHLSDISQIVSSSEEEQIDYVYGLLFLIILLFNVLFAWVIILITLRYMGYERVGFLSGHNFVRPHKKNCCSRPFVVRSVFILSGIVAILSCAYIVIQGVTEFDETLVSFDQSIQELSNYTTEFNDTTTITVQLSARAKDISQSEGFNLANFCPKVDFNEEFNVDIDFEEISNTINDLGDYVIKKTEEIQRTVADVDEVLSRADSVVERIWSYLKYVPYVIIPIASLVLLLILGALLAAFGGTNRMVECLFLVICRLLFITTIIFWFLSCVIGIVGILNSDLCSGGTYPGSPDGTINDFMIRFKLEEEDPNLYDIIRYYTGGCRNTNPFEFLEVYEINLSEAMDSLQLLINTINNIGMDKVQEACGTSAELQVEFEALLQELDDFTTSTLNMIDCPNINAIYRQVVHESFCASTPTATFLVFAFLLGFGFFGMIMVTLRSSLLETYIHDDDKDEQLALDADFNQRPSQVQKSDTLTSTKTWENVSPSYDDVDPIGPNDIKAAPSSRSWEEVPTTPMYEDVKPVPVSTDTKN